MASIKMVMALFLIISLIIHPTYSQECKSMSFSTEYTFTNCMNLPTLKATLHWTYNGPKSTLSMAYTAPSNNGWVAFALNPTEEGMVGAQTLMAFQTKPAGPITIDTVDIKSYHSINFGPISYNVTGLSGEESSGKITIFGTWVIPSGDSKVNMVWQVGPVSGGKPDKHAMEAENFRSKERINLANGVIEVSNSGDNLAPSPTVNAPGHSGAVVGNMVSIFSLLGALLVYLL